MTPEQRKQAEAHASRRPIRESTARIAGEPSIRDPERLAEIRAQLVGKEGPSAPSSLLAEFGRVLRAERERRRLSLSEMSALSGIEKGAISKLENGLNANPTLDTLRKCAEALGKSVSLGLADREES
jgi:hypothetical protein